MFIFPAGTTCLFLRKKQTGFQMLDWSSEMFCPKNHKRKNVNTFPLIVFPRRGGKAFGNPPAASDVMKYQHG